MTAEKYLRTALIVVGLVFIGGIYALMNVWPEGWTWEPRQYEYEQMIMGIYAVLGVFLLIASRNPLEHKSLIWFTVWSSIVHAAIMAVQALVDPAERPNLFGDVPALFIVGIVLAVLTRKADQQAG
ncbi:MAG TPA: DUF6632 domain-containing protein [Acidobacteriota bacterium]|nr:DUF6632 domain-containing protein [Acidobacteriota bacterium]